MSGRPPPPDTAPGSLQCLFVSFTMCFSGTSTLFGYLIAFNCDRDYLVWLRLIHRSLAMALRVRLFVVDTYLPTTRQLTILCLVQCITNCYILIYAVTKITLML